MLKWPNIVLCLLALILMAMGLEKWSILSGLLIVGFNSYLIANIFYFEE